MNRAKSKTYPKCKVTIYYFGEKSKLMINKPAYTVAPFLLKQSSKNFFYNRIP